jgi:hypothetical protein
VSLAATTPPAAYCLRSRFCSPISVSREWCSTLRLIAEIAYQNKAVIYDLLFKASSETLLTIAADPEHCLPQEDQDITCYWAASYLVGAEIIGDPNSGLDGQRLLPQRSLTFECQ